MSIDLQRAFTPGFLWAFLTLLLLPVAAPADDEEHGKEDGPAVEASVTAPLGAAPCRHGFAGPYPCRNVDLLAALPMAELGGGISSDLWAWVDEASGREFVLLNRSTGTSFVEVTDPAQPVYVGNLPHPGGETSAGDVKVYQDHAFIIGENTDDHGLVVFDLRKLLPAGPTPRVFEPDGRSTRFTRAHNVALDEESGFAYAVYTSECGGLHAFDVRNPTAPQEVGCWDERVHDAQCVVYRGPDPDHQGREICFASAARFVDIIDFTVKASPKLISRIDFQGRGYVHQGWLTSDQSRFVFNDEADERRFDHPTRTYVAEVSNLDAPYILNVYRAEVASIDHNLFVENDVVYAANYTSGLRVLHLDDPVRGRMSEIGYFDVVPATDEAVFAGAWSAWPYLRSGAVAISTYGDGLFLVRPRLADARDEACPLPRGSERFCELCGPCAGGEGRCTTDDDCAEGFACVEDFGRRFALGPRLDVCAWPASFVAEPTAFVALPALTTSGGELPRLEVHAVNDAGQVVGTARDGGARSAAFLYTPGVGMESLDPDGALLSEGLAINGRGDVFGRLLDVNGRQIGVFLHRAEEGFDFLQRGAVAQVRERFQLRDMNDGGDLVGGALRPAFGHEVPYLYTAEDGWRDLSGADPSLRGTPTIATRINGHGEVLLLAGPEEGPWRSAALVDGPGGEKVFVDLGRDGEQANLACDLNDQGRIAGTSWDAAGKEHAYVVRTRGGRPVEMHPPAFQASALSISPKGVVAGLLRRGGATTNPDMLFTWDGRRQRRLKPQLRRADLEALLGQGNALVRVDVADVNDRQEVVGSVTGTQGTRFFLFSPVAGVLDLDVLLRAAGSTDRVTGVVEVNGWGQVLVRTGDGAGVLSTVLPAPNP